jgi:hypothetical protein
MAEEATSVYAACAATYPPDADIAALLECVSDTQTEVSNKYLVQEAHSFFLPKSN